MTKSTYHIVHTESSGGWGGQEIRILTEAKAFMAQGHTVTLVVDNDTPIAMRAKEYGINTVELPIGKKTFKGLLAMRRWIANNEFDVINTHSSSDSWMVALGMRLTTKRRPLVRTRHVSAPVSNNLATCWLYRKASDYIVTTGEKLRETLIRDNGIDPNNIMSVPTGIDCTVFTPAEDKSSVRNSLDLPTDKTIIGILATLRSWKGHQYLIEAFHQLQRDDIHLLIVGDGPQWDNLKQQISEFKLNEQVTMCGDQKNVVPWLQAMDIFVLPSYANEGVPQSIMQAMACQLPAISTTAGSITELVNEKTGIIIEQKDTQSTYEAIKSLLDSPQLAQTLGKNALEHVNKNHDIQGMYRKMHKAFSQCSLPLTDLPQVVAITKGSSAPSFRHRIKPLLQSLSSNNLTCYTCELTSSFYLWRIWKNRAVYKNAKAIILHKLLLPTIEVYLLKMLNKHIVLDIDDAVYVRPPKTINDKARISKSAESKFRSIVKHSHYVITGNEYLKGKINIINKNIQVFPTGVKENTHSKKEINKAKDFIITWIGLPSNLRYLEIIKPAIIDIQKQYPQVKLQIICSDFPNWEEVNMIKTYWSKESEDTLLANADIGIMPLSDDEGSEGKCAFKILQYMAAGLPCVASPIGANKSVISDNESGFLAASTDEWVTKLSILIENPDLRQRFGKSGIELTQTTYNQTAISKQYAQFISDKVI